MSVCMSRRPLEDTLIDNMCVVFGHAHTRKQTRSHQSAYPLYRAVFTEGDGAWNAFGLPGTRWRNTHTYTHSKGGLITSALLGFIDTLGNHSLISPQRKEKYTDYMNVCEKEWEEETEWMMGERECEWGSSFTSEMGNVSEVYNNRTEWKELSEVEEYNAGSQLTYANTNGTAERMRCIHTLDMSGVLFLCVFRECSGTACARICVSLIGGFLSLLL